jgi:hypothetical protein
MMMDKLNCHSKNVSSIDVRNLCVCAETQKAILIDNFPPLYRQRNEVTPNVKEF